jgi:cytochrome P450
MAGSMLEAMSHDLHKTRRSAVSNFFSKRNVQALEPLIVQNVEALLQRLKTETGAKIVNLNDAYAAMTMDIICAYCFGTSMDSLSDPIYGKKWIDMLHGGIQIRPVGRQFPWLINTLLDIPAHIIAKVSDDMARSNTWTRQMLPRIEAILAGENADTTKTGHRTIFHEIRDGELSAAEKAPMRLMAESHVLLGAGMETTARTLSVTTFYLLHNEDVGRKLRKELCAIMPHPDTAVTLPQLEALPYLVRPSYYPSRTILLYTMLHTNPNPSSQTAVLHEGLRLAHGVSSRQPRIATHESLIYKQYTIPRGTPVMQSLYLLHMDSTVFPDPFSFQPQRWIANPDLKRNLFAFSRGSRMCLGMKYVNF